MLRKYVMLLLMGILCVSLTAQTPEKEDPKTYVNQKTGKVFWNKKLPIKIYLGTGENSTKKVKLSSQMQRNCYLDTEGVNYIRTQWATDKKGKIIEPKQEVMWPVYADGQPPVSTVRFHYTKKYETKKAIYYDGSISFSISSVDMISGVEKTMYSLNGVEYMIYETGKKIALNQGKNVVMAYGVDRVGNVENPDKPSSNKTIFIDDSAPMTKSSVKGPALGNILAPNCKIFLSANDDASGIKSLQFASTSDKFTEYSDDGIVITEYKQGDNMIKYYAVDNVNNKESEKKYDFFLDKSGPEISFKIDRDEYINGKKNRYVSERSKVIVNAFDNKAGVDNSYYSFEENRQKLYSEPVEVKPLTNSWNKFYYSAIDRVQNVSKLKFFSFYIDRNKPQISWAVKDKYVRRKDTIYVKSSSKIQLIASDKGKIQSGIKDLFYKIDDSEFKSYESTFTFKKKAHNRLVSKSKDNVNNEVESVFNFYVDDTPPEIMNHFSVQPVNSKADGKEKVNVYPSNAYIFLAAIDKVVGSEKLYYSINGGEETAYIGPINNLKRNKVHTINVRAIDYLGNVSKKSFKFAIDN